MAISGKPERTVGTTQCDSCREFQAILCFKSRVDVFEGGLE